MAKDSRQEGSPTPARVAVSPWTRAGQQADLLISGGLDDRLSRNGYLTDAEQLMAGDLLENFQVRAAG